MIMKCVETRTKTAKDILLTTVHESRCRVNSGHLYFLEKKYKSTLMTIIISVNRLHHLSKLDSNNM